MTGSESQRTLASTAERLRMTRAASRHFLAMWMQESLAGGPGAGWGDRGGTDIRLLPRKRLADEGDGRDTGDGLSLT